MNTTQTINLNDPILAQGEAWKARLALEAQQQAAQVAQSSEPQTVIPQPDQNGEFATPLDGALWMAATYDIPQTPLKGKAPFLQNWPTKASTDLAQIRAWAAEYPGCNFGSVAVAGKHFIFEADSLAVRERFKNQGHDFTSSLIIESSPNKGHRYYLSAPGVENVGQNKGEDFSIRANGEQCVSSGSIHPVTGKQYRVAVQNGPLTQPTLEEINFWKSERVEKKTAEVAQQAQIPSGQRNSTLASIAGKMVDLGLSPEKVKQEIIEINEQRCSPPLSRQELESTIFNSIDSKWSKQKDAITRQVETPRVIIGGHVVGQPQTQEGPSSNPANWRDNFKSVGELEQGDVRMLIDGFLPEGTTFIGGLPGEGKTLFALSIAKALTTADSFLGKFFVSETVPVIYLIPESGGRAFRKRCEKFQIPNDPELFLCRTVSEGSTLPLDDSSLLEAIRRLKPVVILDTIIRFSEAQDENQAMQNKALVDDVIRLRQNGAVAVIGLHHATKAMREKGMTLETVLRGTGDIAASADAVYGLLRDSMLYNNGLGPNEIDVACLKPRDFEPPMPFRIAATQKSEGKLFKFDSVIDRYKDFLVVSKSASEHAVGETLERLVREDSAITLEELSKITGQSTWAIRKTLKARHWVKSQGGAKGASRWRVSPVIGFEGAGHTVKCGPDADVNLNAVN